MNVPHKHTSYKKLSCRRDTARRFVLLNILLSHSTSFKLVPFKSLGAVSYLPSIVTMALSCISSDSGAGRVSGQGGQNSSEYCHPFGVGKLDWQCYSMVKKNFEEMSNRLS